MSSPIDRARRSLLGLSIGKYKNFEKAMWTTVSGGGDMDTNCAIVGGIIASNPNCELPEEWVAKSEPLPSPV